MGNKTVVMPEGMALRITRESGEFVVRFRFQEKNHEVRSRDFNDALHEAVAAIAALQHQGGLI